MTRPYLFALDEATGSSLWVVSLPVDLESSASPAVANSVVYMPSGDGHLRAFDAATGATLWTSAAAAFPMRASPAVSDGVVYASSDDGTVYAFGLP